MRKICRKKETDCATEKVVNHQQKKCPKFKDLKRLKSLPYTVYIGSNDPEYLVAELDEKEAEKHLKITTGTLDLYQKKRLLLLKIDGLTENCLNLGLFYKRGTLLEAFKVVREISDIEKQYFTRLHPHSDFIREIFENIAILSEKEKLSNGECTLYYWLNHIDNWSKQIYDNVVNEIIFLRDKNQREKLDTLNQFIYEVSQEFEIRKLFAEEIQIIQNIQEYFIG